MKGEQATVSSFQHHTPKKPRWADYTRRTAWGSMRAALFFCMPGRLFHNIPPGHQRMIYDGVLFLCRRAPHFAFWWGRHCDSAPEADNACSVSGMEIGIFWSWLLHTPQHRSTTIESIRTFQAPSVRVSSTTEVPQLLTKAIGYVEGGVGLLCRRSGFRFKVKVL